MVKKVVRKQRGGGFKPLKIGGTKKNPRQAKPGYDQEFTLPRGTSAAPIKQIWSRVKKKDAKKYILNPAKAKSKAEWKEKKSALKRPAMSAALTTVVGGELGRQQVYHRKSRELGKRYDHQKKEEQRKSRTRSRASQRGVKKRP